MRRKRSQSARPNKRRRLRGPARKTRSKRLFRRKSRRSRFNSVLKSPGSLQTTNGFNVKPQKIVGKLKRKLDQRCTNYHSINTYGDIEVSTLGKQNYRTLLSVGHYTDIVGFLFNAMQYSTGTVTTLVSGYETSMHREVVLMMKAIYGSITIKNFENTPMYCDLYFVRSKADSLQACQTRNLQPQVGDCVYKWVGACNTFADSYTTPSPLHIGNKPFDYQQVSACWKLLKKKSLILSPGAEHTVNVSIGLNKVIRYSELHDLGAQSSVGGSRAAIKLKEIIRGLTYQVFAVWHGGMSYDHYSDETAIGESGITTSSLGFRADYKYSFKRDVWDAPYKSESYDEYTASVERTVTVATTAETDLTNEAGNGV